MKNKLNKSNCLKYIDIEYYDLQSPNYKEKYWNSYNLFVEEFKEFDMIVKIPDKQEKIENQKKIYEKLKIQIENEEKINFEHLKANPKIRVFNNSDQNLIIINSKFNEFYIEEIILQHHSEEISLFFPKFGSVTISFYKDFIAFKETIKSGYLPSEIKLDIKYLYFWYMKICLGEV